MRAPRRPAEAYSQFAGAAAPAFGDAAPTGRCSVMVLPLVMQVVRATCRPRPPAIITAPGGAQGRGGALLRLGHRAARGRGRPCFFRGAKRARRTPGEAPWRAWCFSAAGQSPREKGNRQSARAGGRKGRNGAGRPFGAAAARHGCRSQFSKSVNQHRAQW